MATDANPANEVRGPFTNPWPFALTGLAAGALAWAWFAALGDAAALVRVVLLALAFLAAGAAVTIRPASPLVLALAAATGLLSWGAIGTAAPAPAWDPSQVLVENPSQPWDSARLLVLILSLVALAAAGLMLLPRVLRRIVFSLLILVHFGGIFCAVMSVPPQPWLTTQAWIHIYRPYLEFMYLNNAYHFYSPDPGPANLLWFRVEYEDGTARWIKMPNREDYPLAINYQRRLSMTESTHQLFTTPPHILEYKAQQRLQAASRIPLHPDLDLQTQYREPNYYSKRMISAYARHIAATSPHLLDPSQKVTSVKIYRVLHWILRPGQMVEGIQPDDERTYFPFYQGEFDADGNLKDPHDPLLYWLIPIIKQRKPGIFNSKIGRDGPLNDDDFLIRDYVKVHTGDVAE